MSNKNRVMSVLGVAFMFVFFIIGGITRQIYLTVGTEWLKGVPQFMAALSLLSPVLFSIHRWMEKRFWFEGFGWKFPFLFLYILIVAFFIYFGFDAYMGK